MVFHSNMNDVMCPASRDPKQCVCVWDQVSQNPNTKEIHSPNEDESEEMQGKENRKIKEKTFRLVKKRYE